jgi:hypothetical protein
MGVIHKATITIYKTLTTLCVFGLTIGLPATVAGPNRPFYDKFDHNVNMLICNGQSLSFGEGATNKENNFRIIASYKGGCNEWESKVDLDNPKSISYFYGDKLVKSDSIPSKTWPPVVATAVGRMELLEQEDHVAPNDYDKQSLLLSPGYSGVSIEKNSNGTEYHERLPLGIKKGFVFSKKTGKSFGVPCLFWARGKAKVNDSEIAYYSRLKGLFADLNQDIIAITGQQNDVAYVTYQTAPVLGTIPYPSAKRSRTFNDCGPSLAQLKLAKEANHIFMGGAMYQYGYHDLSHPKDRVVENIPLGMVAKRVVKCKTPLPLFSPKAYNMQKSNGKWQLAVTYNVPVFPMGFNLFGDRFHNLNSEQENFGFRLLKAIKEEIIVGDSCMVKGNTLVIECSENPKKALLDYALDQHHGGGNLCNSQRIKIKSKNIDYTSENYYQMFKRYRNGPCSWET